MPSDSYAIDQFYIKVDGTDVQASIVDMLSDALVEDDLAQPAMFVLRFHDPEFTVADGTLFKLGAEVVLSASNRLNTRKVLMTGEVTSVELEMDQDRTDLVVYGYDFSHRLYRSRKPRTFLKQTDSNIASSVIQEAGLTAEVESTSEQHDYVMQSSQTDMEFLRARAARIGFQVFADGRKIKFKPVSSSPPAAPAQKFAETLLSFRARISGVGQPNTVEVRGWDPKSKQAIVGTASSVTTASTLGVSQNGGQLAQQAFGAQSTVKVVNQPVGTQAEATKLAQAILDDLGNAYLSAEGTCLGEPDLKAGKLVQVSSVGTKFSGSYFVTATRHSFTQQEGYRTTFTVNGRSSANVLVTLTDSAPRDVIDGSVVGIVTNLNDPDALGRVKVKYPWLDDTQESDWARVVAAGGGGTRGWFISPEINDEVLVAFEHGDIHKPYVIGGLWNSQDKPPSTAVENGKVKLRTLKSRAGHVFEFGEDEGANKGYIQLKTSAGKLITISDTDKKIEIASASHTVTMDDQGQAIKITSGGTLEMSGSGQSIKLTQSGIEISGPGGKLAIAPAGIELAANANLTMKGNANVDISANALMNVKSSAIMNIQGTLVKIN